MSGQPEQPIYVAKQISPDVESAGNIAIILEIVFGLFGVLGVGHAYANRLGLGIALLLGWWVFIGFSAFIISITLGIAACIFGPLYIAIPIISGIQARGYVRKMEATGNWGPVLGMAGGGCLIFIIATIGTLFALGVLGAALGSM